MAKRIVWHGTFKNFKADAKGKVTLAFSGRKDRHQAWYI